MVGKAFVLCIFDDVAERGSAVALQAPGGMFGLASAFHSKC